MQRVFHYNAPKAAAEGKSLLDTLFEAKIGLASEICVGLGAGDNLETADEIADFIFDAFSKCDELSDGIVVYGGHKLSVIQDGKEVASRPVFYAYGQFVPMEIINGAPEDLSDDYFETLMTYEAWDCGM